MIVSRTNRVINVTSQYARRTGKVYEITKEIVVDARGAVWLVWEAIVGYIFTKSGSSLKTKDGSIIKCKNQ